MRISDWSSDVCSSDLPRRADDDLHALSERAAFLAGVHAADAGGDARAGLGIEPAEFAADLKREFARRRDDQRERRGRKGQAAVLDQLVGHREAEGDGLARAGLCRDEKIAALGLGLGDMRLNGGESFIAARGKGVRKDGRKIFERHFVLLILNGKGAVVSFFAARDSARVYPLRPKKVGRGL